MRVLSGCLYQCVGGGRGCYVCADGRFRGAEPVTRLLQLSNHFLFHSVEKPVEEVVGQFLYLENLDLESEFTPLTVLWTYKGHIYNKVLAGGRYSNAEFTLKDCCCNFSHTIFFWDHPQNLRSEANLHFFLWVTTTTCDRLKEAIWELAGAKEDIKQAKCVVVLGSHATGPQPIGDDRKRHILSPKFFPFSPLASFPVSLLACSVITTPSLKTRHWSDRSCCVQSTSTSRFLTPRTESCAVWTVQWSDIDM